MLLEPIFAWASSDSSRTTIFNNIKPERFKPSNSNMPLVRVREEETAEKQDKIYLYLSCQGTCFRLTIFCSV